MSENFIKVNKNWLVLLEKETANMNYGEIMLLSEIDSLCNGYASVEYNLSIPVATDEVVNNLKTMREIGAISLESVMEKSDLIKDVSVEKDRLGKEIKCDKT